MNKPHKHAEVIKAWADGAEIEYRGICGDWRPATSPSWIPTLDYRVKHHKWQKELDAWKAGKEIEFRANPNGSWLPFAPYPVKSLGHYTFSEPYEYRIKPEKVVQDVCVCWINHPISHVTSVRTDDAYKGLHNVRFTFKDGKMVGVELLK